MCRCVLSGLLRQWYPWIIPIATSRQWTVSLECMVVGPYSGRTSTLNFSCIDNAMPNIQYWLNSIISTFNPVQFSVFTVNHDNACCS